MMLNKLSKEARELLLADMESPTTEAPADILELIEISDAFDRRGCFEAADKIDSLVCKLAQKRAKFLSR